MIKTLADFKRLPVGTKIVTLRGIPKYQGIVREIIHKQSNAIKFEGDSWLYYPTSKEFRVEGDRLIVESRTEAGDIWNVLEYKIVL